MLISVIIPCYNVEKYIDRCLTSLTIQTIGIENLQIICVDDASTDNTWTKLQEWEQKFPESVTIVRCEVNGKQGTARNVGLMYAEAPYVSFVDSDDWVEKDYFERLYEPVTFADYDVVTCSYQRDSSSELTFFEKRDTGEESRALLIDSVEKRKTFFNLYSCGHPVWGKIIRRQILEDNDIRFPDQITYEDAYFEALLHFYVERIYILEEQLYHYFVNQNSTILSKNADHHTDWITVQIIKWNAWKERGLLELYREELEYEFLWSCYLGFIKLLGFRYETPSYSTFLLVRELTLSYIPDYRTNKYAKEGFTEFQKLLLQTLYLPIDREQFGEIMRMVKLHGV